MKALRESKGFTLIELLLVIVIIGLLLAVIVPRAWRANIDAKYGLVRQNASELASYAQQWAENGIASQDEVASTATLVDYFATLVNFTQGQGATPNWKMTAWIATTSSSNWNNSANTIVPQGRLVDGSTPGGMLEVVENLVPPDKIPRNPFNGVSVFESPNYPTANPITGAMACSGHGESTGGWIYFAFLWQGTDSTTTTAGPDAPTTTFFAGQDSTLEGLRNGVFLARAR